MLAVSYEEAIWKKALTFRAVAKGDEKIAKPARLRCEISRSCWSVASSLMSNHGNKFGDTQGLQLSYVMIEAYATISAPKDEVTAMKTCEIQLKQLEKSEGTLTIKIIATTPPIPIID